MPNRRELGYVSAGSTSTVYVSTGIYGRATGGIGAPTAVTISSVNYEYLTFNATGTLTVTTAGWFDYLAIGGGGGNISRAATAAGGGGAGQAVFGSIYLSANQTITIGAGSSNSSSATFLQAGNTSIAATSPFTQTALGNINNLENSGYFNFAYVGGGNGAANARAALGITGSTALGFPGGNSTSGNNAGGGGGQSAAGSAGSGTTGGAAGAGFDIAVFVGGSTIFMAQGGGGGGSGAGGAAATNGVAGSATTTPPNGSANTGQGGGGGYGNCTTGNGGSGICYIRWKV